MATGHRTSEVPIGQGWHRVVLAATVIALVVEGLLGAIAMVRDFGGELASTVADASSTTGVPLWVFAWELLQLLGAISLVFIAIVVLHGSRVGYFTALVMQGAAVALTAYRVVDTLPDTFGLIAIVAATTILLSTKSVRDWCLGRSDDAFEHLIADHTVTVNHSHSDGDAPAA